MTAKMTAKTADVCGRGRIVADDRCLRLIFSVCWRTVLDDRPAVFKTVCGALLRRPGWVRFPSIPATSEHRDSQVDKAIVLASR